MLRRLLPRCAARAVFHRRQCLRAFRFPQGWLGWPTAEKRNFLGQAGFRFSDQFNAMRAYCREVSIAFLETSLLDVLKHCLLDDLFEISKAPIIYPIEFAKDIDEKALPYGQGLMLRYVRLRQTQLICECRSHIPMSPSQRFARFRARPGPSPLSRGCSSPGTVAERQLQI